MHIRKLLSRLKGKLKKGLGIGSRDITPASSSANRSSVSVAASPGPSAAPVAGQDTSFPVAAHGANDRPAGSRPNIDDNSPDGDAASPGTRLHTESNDGNPISPHTVDTSASPPLGAVTSLLPVDTTSNDPAGVHDDNPPAEDSITATDKQPSKAGLVWTGAKVLLRVVNASADAFPPLKSAVSGLKEIIDIYEGVSKGRADYGKTLHEVNGLLEELEGYLQEQGAMEMTGSVKRVCCELESEVDNLKAKATGPVVEQWLKAVDAPGEISACHSRIQKLLQRLTLNATVNIMKQIDKQDMASDVERQLKDMSPALAAIYDSAASDEIGRRACTPGTREPQIKQLLDWARTPQTSKLYWMNGMAGTGKTTIAYSVCTELGTTRLIAATEASNGTKRNGVSMLAASFFCSRAIPECCQVKNIIPTIAYQLARYSLPFRSALHQILESEHDVCSKALKIQYQKLIVDPLGTVQGSLPTEFIVVIDALDECENVNILGEILDLILSTSVTLPIKFIVSSRPESEICERLSGNTRLVLHELESTTVQVDIEKYMRQELKLVPLTDVQWSALLTRCGVLFIYASTTCRYIKQGYKMRTLDDAVATIVNSDLATTQSRGDNVIDSLYLTILQAAFRESLMDPDNRTRMRNVLETVICAQEPMTLEGLAELLGLKDSEQVEALLQPLRSVINVTTATGLVTTLHASFPDFMLSAARSQALCCSAPARHTALAQACIHLVATVEPMVNICQLALPTLADEKVEDLDERVKKYISPALAYACRYWSIHLYSGEHSQKSVESVRGFFLARLLIWMEVLNLTKRIRFGPSIIQYAERWCSENAVPEDISTIAHDAQQFVSVYATNPVCQSTLHIYMSMLPFWPKSRPVSIEYMPRAAKMVEPKGTAIDQRQTSLLATWKISRSVSSISLSADGTQMAAASDNAIDLLDTSTGEGLLHVQEAQTNGVETVAISPDGTRVAFGGGSGAYLLDVSTRQITKLYPEQISRVLHVAFSPDGSRVAIGSSDSKAYICSAEDGDSTLLVLDGHTGLVYSVTFSPDGKHVASGADDKKIRIWDTTTGQMVGEPLQGHAEYVLPISYSSDGSCLASSFYDGTIQVWNLQTRQTVFEPIKGHSGLVRSVVFSPDGTFIASGSDDRTIRVDDATTGQTILGPLQAHTGYVRSVIITPDNARLFSCSDDGTIHLWNVQDRHVPDTQHPTVPRRFLCVRYSPDGLQVVSGSSDGAVCVWDVQTGDIVLGPLQGHTHAVFGVDYSPNGAYIASASWDLTLRIWSAQDGKDIHGPIQGHTDKVNWVRFSADSLLLVSGLGDRTVRIWDVQTGQQLHQPLRGHSGLVWSVAFSPNRSHVVSGSSDRTIRVWDIQTGQTVIDPLQGHDGTVLSVEFSADGSRILSGSGDGSIRIWDAVTGQSLLVFGQGHGGMYLVGLSPDGGLVVSGLDDRTVCVWNAQSGQLMLTLDGHTNAVQSVQFSPDGSHVVSCSHDGTIRFWDVSSCQAHVRDNSVKDDGERNDYSQIEAASKPWLLRDDGWVVDRQDQLLVWVPSDLQPSRLSKVCDNIT
ncbi:unnamed protein product [Rhizoctonia solani]|uniref:Nephrocystin 3-like N-terminal domain-containing protein n=1 Tax=Rhizoctonia solani TaxID=456999 RepID=A0A8H3HJJ5_9AGAM|nr:unnamed protein product [Rhizoctonia solani]